MSSTLLHEDVLRSIVLYSADQGICSAIRVCKSWNTVLENDEFWGSLITKKGIPLVENIDKGFKIVYRNLSPRTISGEMIREYFGEIRDIPRMALDRYTMFVEQMDPFVSENDPEQKINKTFFLVVNPSHVYRLYDEELFNLLSASENKEDHPELVKDGKEMKIPMTLTNRIKLLEYRDDDLFNRNPFLAKALLHCNSPLDKTNLWLMREYSVYQKHTYDYQKRNVEEKRFQLIPLSVRAMFNGLKIRDEDSCPDEGCSFTRTSNMAPIDEGPFPVAVGGYSHQRGMIICRQYGGPDWHCGVVPGLPAEARPRAIEIAAEA